MLYLNGFEFQCQSNWDSVYLLLCIWLLLWLSPVCVGRTLSCLQSRRMSPMIELDAVRVEEVLVLSVTPEAAPSHATTLGTTSESIPEASTPATATWIGPDPASPLCTTAKFSRIVTPGISAAARSV